MASGGGGGTVPAAQEQTKCSRAGGWKQDEGVFLVVLEMERPLRQKEGWAVIYHYEAEA